MDVQTSPCDVLRDDAQLLSDCAVHQLAQRLPVEASDVALHLQSWWGKHGQNCERAKKGVRGCDMMGRLTDVVLSQRCDPVFRFLREDVVEVDPIGVLEIKWIVMSFENSNLLISSAMT